MIRKLKLKFVLLAALSVLALLAVLVSGMNLINYRSVVAEADEVLGLISQNNGNFPEFEVGRGGRLPRGMSPELPYESRYFSVLLSRDGGILRVETARIAAVDRDTAASYAQDVFRSGARGGFADRFRYLRSDTESGVLITFLDCGRKLDTFYNFLTISSLISLAGFVIVFLVIFIFSGRFIRPIAESYEKQKRFITDAGHEIKTPLTIIRADADVMELELGENEWLADIRKQTARLSSLTNDLVFLSRMEEEDASLQKIEFPVSDVVSETAASFQALAQTQGKTFRCSVQPMLSFAGDEKAIQQLVSILLDNALKYSPEGGTVSLSLTRQSRALELSVFNTTETEIPKGSLEMLFERFYRTDPSRSSHTGGHGIGLSIAKAIVTAHGGKLQAETEDGRSLRVTALLPV